MYASDTLYNIPEQIRVQDPYNTMFVLGLNGSLGIWMTRRAQLQHHLSWIRLADAPPGTGVKAIEFVEQGEAKGDVMFYTGWNGSVTRVTGLRDVYTQEDVNEGGVDLHVMLPNAGSAVTGLAWIQTIQTVTIGGYSTSAYEKSGKRSTH